MSIHDPQELECDELGHLIIPDEFVEDWGYDMDGDGGWASDPSYATQAQYQGQGFQHETTIIIGGPISTLWKSAKGNCSEPGCLRQRYLRGLCKAHRDLAWYKDGMPGLMRIDGESENVA